MKKIIMTLFVIALSVVFVYGYADATVSGTCSACHTMHNSQNGTSTDVDLDGDDTPNDKLLRGGCVGCHAQEPSGTVNIVDSVIPQVMHDASTDLAAGNFSGVATNQANGHNLPALSGVIADTANSNPPGYLAAYDPNGTSFDASTFVCAGTNGCHGDRAQSNEFTAVSGAHHGDDTVLKYGSGFSLASQGSDVTTSYRMLLGVQGAEDDDWEDSTTSTDHNGYLGEVYASRSSQASEGNTISELCAQCHGTFHASGSSGIGTASPWIRHPTDVVIPDTAGSEYASISTTYDVTTPMGRTSDVFSAGLLSTDAINGTLTFGASGNAIVICLSCHKAHASGYADALRFDYTNTVAADEGCLHCHQNKDEF